MSATRFTLGLAQVLRVHAFGGGAMLASCGRGETTSAWRLQPGPLLSAPVSETDSTGPVAMRLSKTRAQLRRKLATRRHERRRRRGRIERGEVPRRGPLVSIYGKERSVLFRDLPRLAQLEVAAFVSAILLFIVGGAFFAQELEESTFATLTYFGLIALLFVIGSGKLRGKD